MKRVFNILMAVALMLCATACGGDDDKKNEEPRPPQDPGELTAASLNVVAYVSADMLDFLDIDARYIGPDGQAHAAVISKTAENVYVAGEVFSLHPVNVSATAKAFPAFLGLSLTYELKEPSELPDGKPTFVVASKAMVKLLYSNGAKTDKQRGLGGSVHKSIEPAMLPSLVEQLNVSASEFHVIVTQNGTVGS